MEALPEGWRIANGAGSPLAGYAFACNGSPLRGGRMALVRVRAPQMQLPLIDQGPPPIATASVEAPAKASAKASAQAFAYDASQARTVNQLAREKFKHRLLADILVDLTICEIEGWCKREYIDEIRRLINGIGSTVNEMETVAKEA